MAFFFETCTVLALVLGLQLHDLDWTGLQLVVRILLSCVHLVAQINTLVFVCALDLYFFLLFNVVMVMFVG